MTNAIVIRDELPIRTLVVGRGSLASYQQAVYAEAHQRELTAAAALDEAQRALELAKSMEASAPGQARRWKAQVTRRTKKLALAKRYMTALDSGYLPIPRLPVVKLDWTARLLPPEALEELKAAHDIHAFEWFGIIDGTDAWRSGFPRARVTRRDPILVGMLMGEPFPIAWWR